MSHNTSECLPYFITLFQDVNDTTSKVQFVLTEPFLHDGAERIMVTFTEEGVDAEIGTHDAPDLIITLPGEEFHKMCCSKNMNLSQLVRSNKIQLKQRTPGGFILAQKMNLAYYKAAR